MTRSWRTRSARFGAVLAAALGLMLGGVWADAAQPNDVIEQHWELLSQTLSQADSAESFLGINRGVLPGGSAKFDPQPTATFEVVAKVTAGTGNGVWHVDLVGPNFVVLAHVEFPFSQTTYGLRTASVAWPAIDTPLESIRIHGEATGSPPIIFGAIDVQKAYVKVRQAGTVKKTVGRVPMATRAQVTHTSWTDISDPHVYTHNAADFDPAPAATLRVTGKQYVCGTYEVRLFNVDTNSAVTGSVLTFEQTTEGKETAALTLINGDRYKLQSRIVLGFCAQSSGDPNPIVPTGDLVNADLVLSQSTTDAEG